MRGLEGKIAFVTGASRGIGAAIVKRLAAEGAHVALTYAKSPDQAAAVAKVAEALGVKAPMLQVDSGDADALIAAIDQAAKDLGGLDILINNAGILDGMGVRESLRN